MKEGKRTIQVQGWCHSLIHKLHRAGSGWHGPNYSWPGSHSSPPPTKKQRRRQTDAEADRQQGQTHARARNTHTHRYDEKFQLFSAMRQCISSSRSNISHLGEKHSPSFCCNRPLRILACTIYCTWPLPLFPFWLYVTYSHYSVKRNHSIMRTQDVRFSYLFLKTPGFDDLRC